MLPTLYIVPPPIKPPRTHHQSLCKSSTTKSSFVTFLQSVQSSNNNNMGSLGPTVSVSMAKANGDGGHHHQQQQPELERKESGRCAVFGGGGGRAFRMPLHYPRYRKADYEAMPEWRVDCLLREYGLPVDGDLDSKRRFAMGAFLWPGQY